MIDFTRKPHSADVKLTLLVGGQRIPLAKVAPDRVVLRTPQEVPAAPATIEVSVDGEITQTSVQLSHGASSSELNVEVAQASRTK